MASKLYLVLGLCSVFARLLAGRLCDFTFVNRRYLYHICLSVTGISTLLCPLAKTFPTLLLYFITFGFFDGAQSAVANVLLLNAVCEEQRARAFGTWLFFLSLSMASGPPLAGKWADVFLTKSTEDPPIKLIGLILIDNLTSCVVTILNFLVLIRGYLVRALRPRNFRDRIQSNFRIPWASQT